MLQLNPGLAMCGDNAAYEPHFEPSPEQIEAIDRYRGGIELSRVDVISLLVDVGLRRVRTGNMD